MSRVDSARFGRWYPARLFFPREQRRTLWVSALFATTSLGVPLIGFTALFARARFRRAAALRAGGSVGTAMMMPVLARVPQDPRHSSMRRL